jgi:hypothetical protein
MFRFQFCHDYGFDFGYVMVPKRYVYYTKHYGLRQKKRYLFSFFGTNRINENFFFFKRQFTILIGFFSTEIECFYFFTAKQLIMRKIFLFK